MGYVEVSFSFVLAVFGRHLLVRGSSATSGAVLSAGTSRHAGHCALTSTAAVH